MPTLQKDSSVAVKKAVTIGYQGLTLNLGNKNGLLKPYSNVGTDLARSQYLRTAFDTALDRTTINKVVFGGLNQPDCYPIAPVSPWYKPVTQGLSCNLHANTALANDASWGRPLAKRIYSEARPLYHPLVTRELDKLKL